MMTDYHAKYIAHELTRRCPSDSVEKLTAVLSDAQVDLNPHQIEAALFAFRNPLSRGAILADEVGLGKTIEAGLLIAQSWAEGKRRILVIVPANLRKQWSQELADKFFLPSAILENSNIQRAHPGGQPESLPAECHHHLFLPVCPEDGALHPPDALGSGGHRRSPPAPQCLQADEQDRQRHQAICGPVPQGAADRHAAAKLALGTLRPGEHHRRFRLRRPEDLPHPVHAARQRRRFQRIEGAAQANLQADASQAGAGIRQVHEPPCLRAGIRARRPRSSGSTTWFPNISSSRRSTPCRPANAP